MTGLLMSDDGLNGFTESLDTTFDLATLVSPLCVKSLLIKVLLVYHFPLDTFPPYNIIMNSWY